MLKQPSPWKPNYLAEDSILCAELIEHGGKFAASRLDKEMKGMYFSIRTPVDCSSWWTQSKKGKKKDKRAVFIMADDYYRVIKELDMKEGKVLQLEAEMKSQEKEITFLQLKLQEVEGEKHQLLQFMSETKSQEKEIKLLRQKLQQQEDERHQLLKLECKIRDQERQIELAILLQQQMEDKYDLLKFETDGQLEEITLLRQTVQKQRRQINKTKHKLANYNISRDETKESTQIVTSSPRWKRPPLYLLQELPNLQYDNSNYEFWAKIKSWLLKGEVDPQCVFNLVQLKCPVSAWDEIKKNFKDNKDLTKTAISNPLQALVKLWEFVSKALRPGTNLFEEYYFRRQKADETFEEYLKEKFRLYCSYSLENMEPDTNDRHFLYNAIEKAATCYHGLVGLFPKSYTDLLNKAINIDMGQTLIPANNNYKFIDYGRNGHNIAQRKKKHRRGRRGRPCKCFTCGRYGHCYWECWSY